MRCAALDCPRPAGATDAAYPELAGLCSTHRLEASRYRDRAAALERLVRTGSVVMHQVQSSASGALCTRCGVNPPGPLVHNVRPDRVTLCSLCRDHASRRPAPGEEKHRIRARTVSIKRLSKRDLQAGTESYPLSEHALYDRPRTRGDCLPGGCNAARPCPWVSCKHHLALDVNERTGSIKLNFPDVDVWDLGETCALDVADRNGATLEESGSLLNLTRERIRQIECKALARATADESVLAMCADYLDHSPRSEAALPSPYGLGGLQRQVSDYQRAERSFLYSLGWYVATSSATQYGNQIYWCHPVWGNALSVEHALRVTEQHHAPMGARRAA